MDYQSIAGLISSVGFPIAACCAIFWQMNKQTEQHKQEMDKMTDALTNNTAAIVELSTLIKKGDDTHV